jgi:hypothetical protein
LALVLTLTSHIAGAAETRFQHVSLLAASDRVSLVFELTGEPQNVATRRISAAVLELDAGPVVMPSRATSFMAPPGVRFVMGVSIQGGDVVPGRLKARITMLERVRSAVRVVGNRVYVDFSPESEPASKQPVQAAERQPVPLAPAAAPVAPPAASSSSMRDAYRATIQPALDRFEQLTPFLLSATVSPSEPVLKAVGSTLVGIQGLLQSVDVPADARRVHDAVSSAVAAALTAVSPTFGGDRAAQAKQALGLLEQAKSSW